MRYRLGWVVALLAVIGSADAWERHAVGQDADSSPKYGEIIVPASSVATPVPFRELSDLIASSDSIKWSSSGSRNVAQFSKLDLSSLRITAHTNYAIFRPDVAVQPATPATPSAEKYYVETPASIACLYGLAPAQDGCNPNKVAAVATGGSNAIGIVVAYHAANAESDLREFSRKFGLLDPDFHQYYATANHQPPPADLGGNWAVEATMDIEWAHAMAPKAKIILVEAKDNDVANLVVAEDLASQLVSAEGGGVISNSWSTPELPGVNATYNRHFSKPGIVYVAASGDTRVVEYPASSDLVVAVGGTSIQRDADGNFKTQVVWDGGPPSRLGGGAGPSSQTAIPAFQAKLASTIGKKRGVADIAAVADMDQKGVYVYVKGYPKSSDGWLNLGGTSAAAPIVAGIINAAAMGQFPASSREQLARMYAKIGTSAFFDVEVGKCGLNGRYPALKGWDFCSGVGSPIGMSGFQK